MHADSPTLERDLRAMTADGVAWSAMVGLGETYFAAFGLASGLAGGEAALLATLPVFAGSLLQLATPFAVRRLQSYRSWVVGCARLQAACFVPLIVAAALGRVPAALLFASAIGYWAFGMATGPAWNAWVGELVPPALRAGFFARRTRFAQVSLIASMASAGLLLHAGRSAGVALLTFAGLFACASAARVISSRFLASQSEPAGITHEIAPLDLPHLLARLRVSGARRVLGYLLAMQLVVNFSAPYFTPYMLGPLELSYAGFMTLTAASFLSRVAVMPFLGRLGDRRGAGRLLRYGAILIIPLPTLWLLSDHFAFLLCIQILSGVAWATVELGTLLVFFEGLEREIRTSVLTLFNVANAAAMASGALLGGVLFRALGEDTGAFHALFVASALARLASLPLLRRVPLAPAHVQRTGEHVTLRTLAVRPSAGALQRPIVATIEDEEAPEVERASEGERKAG
jgi:hypothetical protein